ncbi:MAG TPA: hypothetical protein DCZ69_15440, partial [Syntrophobacteraceae bacterium]|nr:hypothetical protein [Syntrophobacteraceae bacterium]
VAPVKQLGIITWMVMAGQSSANATKLSADVWSQYQAGTEKWVIDVETKVSNDEGEDTQPTTYQL